MIARPPEYFYDFDLYCGKLTAGTSTELLG